MADLVRRIIEEVSNYLDSPLGSSRIPTDEDEAQAAIDPIRQDVFQDLHAMALASNTTSQCHWRKNGGTSQSYIRHDLAFTKTKKMSR